MNQKHSFNAIDNVLLALWSIGSFVAILLVITIFRIGLHNIKDIAPLIGAFAILISAGIASMSVMKSIYTTQQNEKKKAEKEESKFYLDRCIESLTHVYTLLGNRQNDVFSWREASSALIDMRDISKYITEKPHQKIFDLEYLKYSSKLFKSMIMTPNGEYSPISSIFFCSGSHSEDAKLKEVFEKSNLKINPQFIIPIFQFSEPTHNSFMKDTMNYYDWKSLDLSKLEDALPWICAIDYLKLYKEKILDKSKE